VALDVKRVRWYPEDALRAIERTSADAEERGARNLLDAANQNVPRLSGELEGSGSVERVEDGVVVTYSAPYAPILRAHPEWDFQGGRSGRWLDEAIESGADAIGAEMSDTVRAGWPG
jgi:hypothetical protein